MYGVQRHSNAHAECDPLMQPGGAGKLIYQNEFRGEHMIREEKVCLNYLRREYDGDAGVVLDLSGLFAVDKIPLLKRTAINDTI